MNTIQSDLMSFKDRMFEGFFIPFTGASLLFTHFQSLWKYLVIPIALTFITFLASLYLLFTQIPPLFSNYVVPWLTQVTSLGHFLSAILLGFAITLSIFVLALFCLILLRALTVPFFTLMATRLYQIIFPESAASSISVSAAIFSTLHKTIIYLFIAVPVLVVVSIPGVQFFSGLLFAFLFTWDCFEAATEFIAPKFSDRWIFIRSHFAEHFGASLGLIVISLIPVSWFILMPITILGWVQFYGKRGHKI